ncbi:sigma-E processing peptidase SpoIIGA [Virgibacillus phasianinus]|uniref:Sporulation sigma-E factor-processing peptidase n=1 Tax=Virgibacillus phasianinus TaxID=2017483 RepID=A0A220U5Z7_9BACI|nr:sigma-E processing peptidase SpoIIGA [Virgibacillus phasianinus]ASK63578.1 sigma-E processing peptidase SpoIIGA [Virgibacillus phasianinus]
MAIYVDVIWLLNFLFDMMLIMLTLILAKESASKKRIILGSFVASMIVPISIYFPDSLITSVVGKFMYSILIILSFCRYRSVYQLFRLLFLFYFVTFTIGGGLIALHFMLESPFAVSSSGVLTFNKGYGDPISWIFVVICFPIVWHFTKKSMDKHAAEKIRYDQFYPTTLEINNKAISTTGYIDSGNQLVDPLTKSPVVICDEPFLKQWFSEDEWEAITKASDLLDFDAVPKKWEGRIHIVPFQGVNGKSSYMLAIKPDHIKIQYDEREIMTNKLLIGIQFSDLTKDQRYHCLLHPQIIKLAAVHSA